MVTVFEPVEAAILRYSKKNGVNENFSKFTGNTCARVLEAEPATLFERDLAQVFLIFAKFSITPF